jgi:hypothetical protein
MNMGCTVCTMDATTAMSSLAPISETLYRAIGAGLDDAGSYFDERGWDESYDVWLYAHLVRATAKAKLLAAGLTCSDDEVPEPAMSGLLVQHGTTFLKIRKSVDGLPPLPSSRQAQDYYEQQSLLPELGTTNLLLLWHNRGSRLESLTVAMPASASRSRRRATG